jgi:hypothetical protein
MPVSLPSWPMIRSSATPARNPMSTGFERKLAMKPRPRLPAAMQARPFIRSAAAPSRCAHPSPSMPSE